MSTETVAVVGVDRTGSGITRTLAPVVARLVNFHDIWQMFFARVWATIEGGLSRFVVRGRFTGEECDLVFDRPRCGVSEEEVGMRLP